MKFVPVPGTNVLFRLYEMRVKDYQAFCDATGDHGINHVSHRPANILL